MKLLLIKFLLICIFACSHLKVEAQIGDIKDLASGAADIFSGCTASDVSAGCDAVSCMWNGTFYFLEFLIDHHQEILNMRYLDPTMLSLEIEPNMAYSFHYSPDSMRYFKYLDFLPRVRANLGIFSTDFRYNLLTEYRDERFDSFKTWDLVFMLNFVPADGFRWSVGSGIYYEHFTDKYYNEHYLNFQFGIFQNKDFIDLDGRVAVDYSTSLLPFVEAGLRYKVRIIGFNHLFVYFSIGGIYQDYYQDHKIVGLSGGLNFNFH